MLIMKVQLYHLVLVPSLMGRKAVLYEEERGLLLATSSCRSRTMRRSRRKRQNKEQDKEQEEKQEQNG